MPPKRLIRAARAPAGRQAGTWTQSRLEAPAPPCTAAAAATTAVAVGAPEAAAPRAVRTGAPPPPRRDKDEVDGYESRELDPVESTPTSWPLPPPPPPPHAPPRVSALAIESGERVLKSVAAIPAAAVLIAPTPAPRACPGGLDCCRCQFWRAGVANLGDVMSTDFATSEAPLRPRRGRVSPNVRGAELQASVLAPRSSTLSADARAACTDRRARLLPLATYTTLPTLALARSSAASAICSECPAVLLEPTDRQYQY
jgi:hypothetical protein